MSDKDEKLMDPAFNDLIPGGCGEAEIEIPELSADYEDRPRPAHKVDVITAMLETTKADPCGFDDGLQLRRTEGSGLHVFKGARIIRDIFELEADELRTIKKYLEHNK